MYGKFVIAIATLLLCGAVQAQEDGDNYPPIQDGWRCLEQGRSISKTKWTMLDVVKATPDFLEDEDCPLVTDEICKEPDYYPYPCKFTTYDFLFIEQSY